MCGMQCSTSLLGETEQDERDMQGFSLSIMLVLAYDAYCSILNILRCMYISLDRINSGTLLVVNVFRHLYFEMCTSASKQTMSFLKMCPINNTSCLYYFCRKLFWCNKQQCLWMNAVLPLFNSFNVNVDL